MVKKVSRFSAIKRAATCCCICFSKDKQQQQQQQRSSSDKKIKRNRNGHKSFIPIFNEPSSIEKILEDAERQTLSLKPLPSSSSQEIAPPSPKDPFPTKPTTTSSTIVDDQLPPTPKLVSSSSTKIQAAPNKRGFVDVDQVQAPPKLVSSSVVTKIQAANRRGHVDADQAPPPPKLVSSSVTKIQAANRRGHVDVDQDHPPKLVSSSVTKIQAAYRGYVARRGYKALKGLVRLQGVTKSESVKKQIMNAMKTMQSFSKLQNEIRLLRIQKLESKAFQRQAQLINNNNNNNNRESAAAAADTQSNEWDDSMLSKHEREARLEKKQEAILLREKAMSYAYTQQHLRYPPHSNSHLPWWWNWIDHKLPLIVLPPTNNNNNSSSSSFDHHHHHYPSSLKKDTLGGEVSPMSYYPRSRPGSSAAGARKFRPFNNNNNDDSSSLVSCPAFSSPHRHYMEQTASAKAKVRPKSNPRQRMMPGRMSQSPGGGTESSSRRFSFPTTPSISGSSKFRESIEQQGSGGLHDKVDRLSMGSPTSVTSRNILDRKPFNRFV